LAGILRDDLPCERHGPGETIEQVSDLDPGLPAWVTFGRKPLALGCGLEPELVEHATLPVTW